MSQDIVLNDLTPAVLLIDDREANLLALEAALRDTPCRLIKFTSGKAALGYLTLHEVALVLLDIQMPEMDGFATALQIKKVAKGNPPPIIFLTAIDQSDRQIEQAYDVGAADFIFKPFSAKILQSKVGVFLELFEARHLQAAKHSEHLLREAKENLELKVQERTKELTQTNSFLDSVLENIPNMIFVKDACDLKFVRFNRAGEDLLGLSRDVLIGKSDYDFFPADQAKAFQDKDRVVLSGNLIADIPEEVVLTKHKGARTLHTRKIPIQDSKGVPKYLVGISEDITEVKKTEADRLLLIQAKIEKQEAEKFAERENFLSAASALLGSSLDFETTLTNLTKLAVPGFADWCSIQLVQPDRSLKQIAVAHKNPDKVKWAWELHEKFPGDLNSPTGPPRVVKTGQSEMMAEISPEMIKVAAQSAEHLKIIESIGFRSYICTPIISRGQVLGALSLVTTGESNRTYTAADLRLAEDLSSRAGVAVENSRLYREAQNLNRVKDEFLATLSHELRTPLNVILGHAEILRTEGGTLTAEEILSSVDAIYRNAKAQTNLIGDLLDVSSIITGKVSFKPSAMNPRKTVENILESLRPTAEAKDVKLLFDFSQTPESVTADPTRLNQIVWNLVSNAIKFTPKDGTVDVTLRSSPQEWFLEVADSGLGIDPEFLPYVFDRFRQEDATNTRRYGGLGLGLSVVRHLVELHGGRVTAESKGKGYGAKFIVSLPRTGAHSDATVSNKKTEQTAPEEKVSAKIEIPNVKVLLVEDSQDNRVLVNRMLTRAGCILVEAQSAAEAREKLKSFHPDVIVSDIGMPEENGIEFIRKLRSSDVAREREVPAVALTAYVRDEEKQATISAGFQAHVGKPVSAPLLLAAIQRVLAR